MTAAQLKKIARIVLPVVLAILAAYGAVDYADICGAPLPADLPAGE